MVIAIDYLIDNIIVITNRTIHNIAYRNCHVYTIDSITLVSYCGIIVTVSLPMYGAV